MGAEKLCSQRDLIDDLEAALLSMDRIGVRRCYENSGLAPLAFAELAVGAALERVGKGWEQGEVALSQVYMSGRICEELLDIVLPPESTLARVHAPVAIAVLEDFHPLGKRIVASVLRANGFQLTDYGPVDVQELVTMVQRDGIRVLVISALMLTSALKVREVRRGLDEQGLEVRILAGGAPFRLDKNLYREVGADATSDSASGAVKVLRDLLEVTPCQP